MRKFILILFPVVFSSCQKDISLVDTSVPEFQRIYGGEGDEEASRIIKTSDGNFLIAGYTTTYGNGINDAFLVKIDPNGNVLWEKFYGGANWDYATDVVETPDGGYLVVGRSKSFKINQGLDVYIFKTDRDGNLLWQKVTGTSMNDGANQIIPCPDNSGYMLIGGTGGVIATIGNNIYLLKVNLSGDTLWTRTYDHGYEGMSIAALDDGSYMLFGNTYTNTDYEGMLLFRVNGNGDSLWANVIDGIDNDRAAKIIPCSDKGFAICGQTNSFGDLSGDMFTAKLNAAGTVLWQQIFGVAGYDAAVSVIETADGGFMFAGATKNLTDGTLDIYLVKTTASGINTWNKTISTPNHDMAYDLLETDDSFFIAGSTFTNGLHYDIFVIKMKK